MQILSSGCLRTSILSRVFLSSSGFFRLQGESLACLVHLFAIYLLAFGYINVSFPIPQHVPLVSQLFLECLNDSKRPLPSGFYILKDSTLKVGSCLCCHYSHTHSTVLSLSNVLYKNHANLETNQKEFHRTKKKKKCSSLLLSKWLKQTISILFSMFFFKTCSKSIYFQGDTSTSDN